VIAQSNGTLAGGGEVFSPTQDDDEEGDRPIRGSLNAVEAGK
jgi:hypothetical protein